MIMIDVEPVIDYLRSLNPAVRAKAYRGIDLLANHWPLITEPHVKRVSGYDGLWELREQYSNTRIRLFFFQSGPDTLVTIYGYTKKTAKTPQRVLKTVIQKIAEYHAKER